MDIAKKSTKNVLPQTEWFAGAGGWLRGQNWANRRQRTFRIILMLYGLHKEKKAHQKVGQAKGRQQSKRRQWCCYLLSTIWAIYRSNAFVSHESPTVFGSARNGVWFSCVHAPSRVPAQGQNWWSLGHFQLFCLGQRRLTGVFMHHADGFSHCEMLLGFLG